MSADHNARGFLGVAFGRLVRDRREALGLTQAQLADALGLGQSAIAYWETGTNVPRAAMVLPLARALSVSVEWLSTAIAADAKEEPMSLVDQSPKRKGRRRRGGR